MEDNQLSCPKCKSLMEAGGVIPRVNKGWKMDSGTVLKWFAGMMKKGENGRIFVYGKDSYFVETYRCVHCGFLESYAKEEA